MAFIKIMPLSAVGLAALLIASGCGKLRECESKQERLLIDMCYDEAAKKKNEPKHCSMIDTPYVRNSCYETVAISLTQPEICQQIKEPGALGQCYTKLAMQSSQQSLCQQIVDPSQRTGCYQSVAVKTQSPTPCEALDGSARDECVQRVAVNLRRNDICPAIRDVASQYRCFDEISRITRDFDGCARIAVVSLRESCLAYVAGDSARFGQNRADICEHIESPGWRSDCYSGVARVNPVLCEKVENTETKRCFDSIDWRKFTTVCGLISDGYGSTKCWRQAAQEQKNPHLCLKVKDRRACDECLVAYADSFSAADDTVCRLVEDESTALKCIETLPARLLKDVSICRRFRDSYNRDKCEFDVQHAGLPR
jgi:hypothetical protein